MYKTTSSTTIPRGKDEVDTHTESIFTFSIAWNTAALDVHSTPTASGRIRELPTASVSPHLPGCIHTAGRKPPEVPRYLPTYLHAPRYGLHLGSQLQVSKTGRQRAPCQCVLSLVSVTVSVAVTPNISHSLCLSLCLSMQDVGPATATSQPHQPPSPTSFGSP